LGLDHLKLKGSPPRHYRVILRLKSLGVAITSEPHLCKARVWPLSVFGFTMTTFIRAVMASGMMRYECWVWLCILALASHTQPSLSMTISAAPPYPQNAVRDTPSYWVTYGYYLGEDYTCESLSLHFVPLF
jgi:hypothetical protein